MSRAQFFVFKLTDPYLKELKEAEKLGISDQSQELLEEFLELAEDHYENAFRQFMEKRQELENMIEKQNEEFENTLDKGTDSSFVDLSDKIVKAVFKVLSDAVHQQLGELEEGLGIDFDIFQYDMKSVTAQAQQESLGPF